MQRTTRRRAAAACIALAVGLATPWGPAVSAAEPIEIAGTPAGRGVVCPQFRLDDGELVSLTGEAPPEGAGRVVLSGRWQPRSPCMQGRSFRVETFRPAETPSSTDE